MEEAEIEKDEAKTNDANDDSQDNFETSVSLINNKFDLLFNYIFSIL